MLSLEGKEKLKNYTSRHTGGMLGVVIDKQLMSAPQIRKAIQRGKLQVAGVNAREAEDISNRFFMPLKSIVPYLE